MKHTNDNDTDYRVKLINLDTDQVYIASCEADCRDNTCLSVYKEVRRFKGCVSMGVIIAEPVTGLFTLLAASDEGCFWLYGKDVYLLDDSGAGKFICPLPYWEGNNSLRIKTKYKNFRLIRHHPEYANPKCSTYNED